MNKHINEVIPSVQTGLNHLKISVPTENYDHIVLTEEEQAEVLRLARKQKHHQQQAAAYREKISKPPMYGTMDFETLYKFALAKSKELIPWFVIDDAIRDIYNLLALYFSGDARFSDRDGTFSLDKGILLLGPLGCGKTSLMKSFTVNSFNAYSVVSCRKVGDDYSQLGADAIANYSNLIPVYAHQYFGQTGIGICFDDLGTESSRKHYGNELNVMAEIILNRYDNRQVKGKTHFTANLTTDQIESMYGARVKSRLREMCNVIEFSPSAQDRRK